MSFNESHHTHQNRRALSTNHPQNRIRKKQKNWGAHAAGVLVSAASAEMNFAASMDSTLRF